MSLPEPVQEHLKSLFVRSRFPAYLFVASDGSLADWGGYCERYGLQNLETNISAADQIDFLAGMLPLDGHWFSLPDLLIHDFRVVDVHFVPGEGGDWVVLLDSTDEAERKAVIQQQANNLRLLEHRQREMLKRLSASNENLLAVFNQLNLSVALIAESGEVSFISRSGLDFLGMTPAEVSGRDWRSVFNFSESDAAAFSLMLKSPGSSGEHLRVKLAGSNGERRFDIDVQRDPRAPDMRIAYFYDVSELLGLRDMLHKKAKFQDMIGKSRSMQRVFERIRDVARFEATVLIEGETGTGKELAARAIHYSSSRKDGPFVVVNCAGLADSLINSQLFGHKKGSFTDAVSDQKGVFEAAHGGTIVLDEIGDIPKNTQTRILRALEQREIIRVGETEARKVDIRIVAATNKNLEDEVAAGNFRLDLLYRIRVARVTLPPLRERREDIALLVEAFVREICLENGIEVPLVERDALSAMMLYSWPGNVRELRNAVEFALINSRESRLRLRDLPPEITAVKFQRACRGDAGAESEKERIIAALKSCGNRRDQAAELLGISRATFYRRLKKYCLNDGVL